MCSAAGISYTYDNMNFANPYWQKYIPIPKKIFLAIKLETFIFIYKCYEKEKNN